MNDFFSELTHQKTELLTVDDFIEKGLVSVPGGDRAILCEASPSLSTLQDFDQYCHREFHKTHVKEKLVELLENMKKIHAQFADELEAILTKHAPFLDSPTSLNEPAPEPSPVDYATWMKIYGAFENESSADGHIKKLSKHNTAQVYQTLQPGRWVACHVLTADVEAKSTTKYSNPAADLYFKNNAIAYSQLPEVAEKTDPGATEPKFTVERVDETEEVAVESPIPATQV